MTAPLDVWVEPTSRIDGDAVSALASHRGIVPIVAINQLFQPRRPIVGIVIRRADECIRERIQRREDLHVRPQILCGTDFQPSILKIKNVFR